MEGFRYFVGFVFVEKILGVSQVKRGGCQVVRGVFQVMNRVFRWCTGFLGSIQGFLVGA